MERNSLKKPTLRIRSYQKEKNINWNEEAAARNKTTEHKIRTGKRRSQKIHMHMYHQT